MRESRETPTEERIQTIIQSQGLQKGHLKRSGSIRILKGVAVRVTVQLVIYFLGAVEGSSGLRKL